MKIKEIRDLSPNELLQKAGELTEELFRLQLRRTSGQLDSSAVLGHVKKDIARLKTVMNEKRRAQNG
jgi:large subunit ribosomal protein L29